MKDLNFIECSSYENISEAFSELFKNKQSAWIVSDKLDFLEDKVPKQHFKYINGKPAVWFSCKESFVSKKLRRLLGLSVSGIGSMITAPVCATFALLIPLESKGPSFYKDERAGKDGKPIPFIKLRSMVPNKKADAVRMQMRKEAFASENVRSKRKSKIDKRISKLGRFIRKYSIDELPQLWLVLKGDVDLVGPRAYRVDETDSMLDWQKVRLADNPGVTGFWQTSGRSNIPFDQSVIMDLYYLANRNVLSDMKIIFKTPITMLTGEGSC